MDIDDEEFTSDDLRTSPSTALPSQSPIDQSEIDDLLVEYPYAAEPTYFTRPNRYHGPASTWRSWTANDRDVAESLDVARAGNLSVHLYNAFDLKRRSRADQALSVANIKSRHDEEAQSGDGKVNASEQFTPPEIWTAWPLRSRHVPRDLQHQTMINSNRYGTDVRAPSASLAEAVLATTLRHAKERWNARTKDLKEPQPRSSKHDWKQERDLTKKEIKVQATDSEDFENDTNLHIAGSGDTTESDGVSNTENEALLDKRLPPGAQLFSSQAFAEPDTSSSEEESSTTGSEEDEPVFSANDDHARQLLQPSIRHMLTKFDDLLCGLHEARAAYATRGDTSRSRSRSVFSGIETTEDEHFTRSGSRTASIKRGRKRKRAPSEPADPEGEQTSRSRGRSTTRRIEKNTQSYVLRDWSDVMGMAILKGWNVETVARASERCARLFGQNMAFRTFHQDNEGNPTANPEEPRFEETLAYVPTQGEKHVQELPHASPAGTPTTKPQEVECIRTSSRCSRCESLKIRCQPINPVSAGDFTKRVPCSSCSSLINPSAPCSGILVQPRPEPTAKTCPYPDCPRYDPAKPFPKNYHLQRHLTDVHGHIYSPPNSPLPQSVTNHTFEQSQSDRGTPEQVRLTATLTCPVLYCPQSTRVYKRSTRLYDHVRKAHPEFDIASLKKIMARTGQRGKYDRSRSRSRQVTVAEREWGGVSDGDPDDEMQIEEQGKESGRGDVAEDLDGDGKLGDDNDDGDDRGHGRGHDHDDTEEN